MRGIALGCFAALLLWMPVGAQQVEFPAGYYSFAEIAQQMSTAGYKVDCARDLQQRLAVIHLKPREWQQAREALERGLEVRFRKISNAENRWILERHPETLRKEKRQRELLAAYAEKERDRDLRLLRLLMDNNTPEEKVVQAFLDDFEQQLASDETNRPKVSREETEKQIRSLVQLFRTSPMELALRDWRAFRRLEEQMEQFVRENSELQMDEQNPFGYLRSFLNQYPLSSFGFSKELLDWAQRTANDKDNEFFKSMGGEMLFAFSNDPQARQFLLLQMAGLFATGYGQAWALDALRQQMRPPMTVLEAIEQGVVVRDYTITMPPEPLAWLVNDVEGKVVPLDSPTPLPVKLTAVASWRLSNCSFEYRFPEATPEKPRSFALFYGNQISELAPVVLEGKGFLRTLKAMDPELLRAYERARDEHQKLLERHPIQQSVKFPHAGRMLLAECLYRWAHEQQQEVVMEITEFGNSQGDTLAKRLASSDAPYLLEQHDSVWILRNWRAFVDRVPDYPLAAMRDLVRSDQSREAWQRFYQSVSLEQARWLMTSVDSCTWNLSDQPTGAGVWIVMRDLGNAWLMMRLLNELPSDLRARLWNDSDDSSSTPISLASLPAESKARLLQALEYCRAPIVSSLAYDSRHLSFVPPSEWVTHLMVERKHGRWRLIYGIPRPAKEEEGEMAERFPIILQTVLPGKLSSVVEEEEVQTLEMNAPPMQ
ncbi:MAG: hypothetical protein KatS3mg016_0949 [Fimbriimonadales bacterium]|nr:MAG: hypothetical protein KatS3mg016_0949 [Fimbriimonadales bacterium]